MVQLLDGKKTAKNSTEKDKKKKRLPGDSGGWADRRLSFVNHQCLCLGANDEKDAFLGEMRCLQYCQGQCDCSRRFGSTTVDRLTTHATKKQREWARDKATSKQALEAVYFCTQYKYYRFWILRKTMEKTCLGSRGVK
jgi:hypothetical protein